MERMKFNAATYLAVGGAAVCGAVCGFLAGQHRARKKADERHATETAALRQHYGTRLAEANAAAKGDHPGDGASAVGGESGHKPDIDWLKSKLAPVVQEEFREADVRGGTGQRVSYSTASGGRSGTPPRSPVVGNRNAFDDAAAEGRLNDPVGEEAAGDAGDASATAGPGRAGGTDALEGIDDTQGSDPDDQDDGAVGIGPLLGPSSKPGDRIQLISEEEFLAHDLEEYAQIELKFFEGDGVLVDERDVPVRSPDMIAGKFATHFGHGTSDPNLVHVRNNVLKIDIEITRRETEYRTEVLGYGVPE